MKRKKIAFDERIASPGRRIKREDTLAGAGVGLVIGIIAHILFKANGHPSDWVVPTLMINTAPGIAHNGLFFMRGSTPRRRSNRQFR